MSTEGGLSRAYDKLRVCSAFTTCDIHMSKYGGTWPEEEEGVLYGGVRGAHAQNARLKIFIILSLFL